MRLTSWNQRQEYEEENDVRAQTCDAVSDAEQGHGHKKESKRRDERRLSQTFGRVVQVGGVHSICTVVWDQRRPEGKPEPAERAEDQGWESVSLQTLVTRH